MTNGHKSAALEAVSEDCRGRCSTIHRINVINPSRLFLPLLQSFCLCSQQMYLEVLCRVSSFKLRLLFVFCFFLPFPLLPSSRPVCVLLRGAVMTLKHEHLKGFWWEPHCLLWRLPKRGFYFVVGFNASVCYLITLRQSREAGIFPDWQSFKNIDHQQDCSWCRPCIFMCAERPDYSYYRIISGEAQFISPDFSSCNVRGQGYLSGAGLEFRSRVRFSESLLCREMQCCKSYQR